MPAESALAPITPEERCSVLLGMNKTKSPGVDGLCSRLPTDFHLPGSLLSLVINGQTALPSFYLRPTTVQCRMNSRLNSLWLGTIHL